MKKWESEYYIQIPESLIKHFLTFFVVVFRKLTPKHNFFAKKQTKSFLIILFLFNFAR